MSAFRIFATVITGAIVVFSLAISISAASHDPISRMDDLETRIETNESLLGWQREHAISEDERIGSDQQELVALDNRMSAVDHQGGTVTSGLATANTASSVDQNLLDGSSEDGTVTVSTTTPMNRMITLDPGETLTLQNDAEISVVVGQPTCSLVLTNDDGIDLGATSSCVIDGKGNTFHQAADGTIYFTPTPTLPPGLAITGTPGDTVTFPGVQLPIALPDALTTRH